MRDYIRKSTKLENVCYDIRGPVMVEAARLEEEGCRIIKMNIGNPAPFGFDTPDEILHDIILNLHRAQGYSDSQGLFTARKAVMQDTQRLGITGVDTQDIWIGNGVSELIAMSLQGLMDDGDELLIPAPDYPLWTASCSLSGGRPVHYRCLEEEGWIPDLDDIAGKITPRTRGIVVINPNNPTGAVYGKDVLESIVEVARTHGLILFSDEIYEKVIYDGAKHIPLASLSEDVLTLTFNGLSKAYRAAGLRGGWLIVSGDKSRARDYLEGLSILANMRLCSNVPAQLAVQTALGGYQSISELTAPDGRLTRQREFLHEELTAIEGISCVMPKGALYLFPRLDPEVYPITDDQSFILEMLRETHVLAVQGTGFNWMKPDHIRLVFLPDSDTLQIAVERIGSFLSRYRNR
ncbi:MAG: pyridoxal phosphate-dependent aminotransferase [Spirochaetaceae bacterium]|nr:pyridoxal phosphate-dependent aminotransferase [Spirochaetaceae bacterium]MDT8297018.1 pyridoxal phosphate-dependent aminotransferase [Spirochaetaceae bacterium]